MDRKFVLTALTYATLGLLLGIVMAASRDHGQLVTHAHIMLVGFVVSFVYALCHKLWLNNTTSTLAKVQFYFHEVGTVSLVTGLYLLYGNIIPLDTIDPFLAASSIVVFIGLILMAVLFMKTPSNA